MKKEHQFDSLENNKKQVNESTNSINAETTIQQDNKYFQCQTINKSSN